MSKKVIGIISARLKRDARLPDKALLPLAGKTMLEHHIERMQAAKGLDGVFLATSKYPGNERLSQIATKCGCEFYAGSEVDVIERHIVLCERYKADACIRIPCDSPLFCPEVAGNMAHYYSSVKGDAPDYLYVEAVPFECGTMPELISLSALRRSHIHYHGPAVTLPVWENWSRFSCVSIGVKTAYWRSEHRLDVDTPADYAAMSHLYASLYDGKPIPLEDAYVWLDDNPHISKLFGGSELSAINRRFMEAQKNAAHS